MEGVGEFELENFILRDCCLGLERGGGGGGENSNSKTLF